MALDTDTKDAPTPRPSDLEHCRWLSRVPLPTAFSYKTFIKKVRAARLTGDYSGLIAYIKQIFSQPTVLNASFLPNAVPSPFSHPTAADLRVFRTGVDAVMVERVFNMLLSLRKDQVTSALFNALQSVVARMVTASAENSATLSDEASFRLVPIVLQAPLLARVTQIESALLVDLCASIQRLPPVSRQRLQEWWAYYPADIFGARLVGMLVRHLKTQLAKYQVQGTRVIGNPTADESVVSIVGILSLLKAANDQAATLESTSPSSLRAASRLVAPEKFYIEDIASHVDLANDYWQWAQLQAARAKPANAPFSFCAHPFLLPPLTKSKILRLEHAIVQATAQATSLVPVLVLPIRRSNLMEDALAAFGRYHPDALRKQLVVEFVGEQGADYGGLTQELFQLVTSELMKPEYGLFVYSVESRTHWFAPLPADPAAAKDRLKLFRTAGVVVGAACYHGVPTHATFPLVLYKKLLRQKASFADLKLADPEMGASLQKLLDYKGDDFADLFGLTFSVTRPGAAGGWETIELVPEGESVPVTRANVKAYVDLYVEYVLNESVKKQADAFSEGFLAICDGIALRGLEFSPQELELIVSGTPVLDFLALEASARYEGGFHKDHHTIRDFWDIVHNELTPEQRVQLLVFCTGSARSPIGGLGQISLLIQRASADTDMVPTSHVCFNALLIPEYSSKQKLKDRLLIAIAHCEGFGLQ